MALDVIRVGDVIRRGRVRSPIKNSLWPSYVLKLPCAPFEGESLVCSLAMVDLAQRFDGGGLTQVESPELRIDPIP